MIFFVVGGGGLKIKYFPEFTKVIFKKTCGADSNRIDQIEVCINVLLFFYFIANIHGHIFEPLLQLNYLFGHLSAHQLSLTGLSKLTFTQHFGQHWRAWYNLYLVFKGNWSLQFWSFNLLLQESFHVLYFYSIVPSDKNLQ